MKLALIAAGMAAALFATPALATDWRTPGQSLYSGPDGNALSSDLQNRARFEKALRDKTAGYVGDSTTNVYSVTSAGCIVNNTYNSAYDHVAGSPSSSNTTTSKCTNNGAVSGSVNGTTSGNISNSN